eukprot:TRINITY_DN7329_c0_g1_i1.p1 TRINITY_DN7329_c0_g1~~TRINITY_DN7329_c0_g1_i1.p1  ORF type:complete len:256 (-),score=30.46 TRINITY_DN7329_c0_g1_i1:3-692(-)
MTDAMEVDDSPHRPESEAETLISQGAEARVYKRSWLGRPTVIKERFAKTYRLPVLDTKINKSRHITEVRTLVKARKIGVDVPAVYMAHTDQLRIYMEMIQGETVKSYLRSKPPNDAATAVCSRIGKTVALLHEKSIIHGDLTTSNLFLRETNQSLVVIDFGLASASTSAEDRAVDLYVLERAFLSTHPNSEDLFETVLSSYEASFSQGPAARARLDLVRMRGRKKVAFG